MHISIGVVAGSVDHAFGWISNELTATFGVTNGWIDGIVDGIIAVTGGHAASFDAILIVFEVVGAEIVLFGGMDVVNGNDWSCDVIPRFDGEGTLYGDDVLFKQIRGTVGPIDSGEWPTSNAVVVELIRNWVLVNAEIWCNGEMLHHWWCNTVTCVDWGNTDTCVDYGDRLSCHDEFEIVICLTLLKAGSDIY